MRFGVVGKVVVRQLGTDEVVEVNDFNELFLVVQTKHIYELE